MADLLTAADLTAQQMEQLREYEKEPADGPAVATWLRNVAPEQAAIGDLSDVLAWLENLGLVESSDDPLDCLWPVLRAVDIMRMCHQRNEEEGNYTVGAAVGMVSMLYLASIEEPDDEQIAARARVTDYFAAQLLEEKTRRRLKTQRTPRRLASPRRARPRQSHRRRVAARRAAGARSGNDPGDDGPAEPTSSTRVARQGVRA